MSDMITTVPASGPTRFGLHAVHGFGKTTIANAFPNPVWIAPENGFPRDLRRRPQVMKAPKHWLDMFARIGWLIHEPHEFLTLVHDTADWIEPLIHRFVCERDSGRKTELNKGGNKLESIEDYGYGKGYVAAEEEFRKYIDALDDLQQRRKMHIVWLMHSHVDKFENPTGLNYDRWVPKVHKRIAGVISEWCENLLYGFYEVEAGKLGEEKKPKGISSGKRLLGTRHNAAYSAKNRVQLPDIVELDDPDTLIPYLLGEMVEHAPMPEHVPAARTTPETPAAKERAQDEKREPAPAQRTAKDSRPTEPPRHESDAERTKMQLIGRMNDAFKAAEDTLGEKYMVDVERWVKAAKGDPEKVIAILERIEGDVLAHKERKAS